LPDKNGVKEDGMPRRTSALPSVCGVLDSVASTCTARERDTLQLYVAIAAIAILAMSAVALAGWASGQMLWASFLRGDKPMAPSMAVITLCFGAILIGYRFRIWPRAWLYAATTLLAGIFLFCLSDVLDHLTGWPVSLDHRLVEAMTATHRSAMMASPVAALLGVLTASACLAMLWRHQFPAFARPLGRFVACCGVAVVLIAALFTLGYFYSAPFLYGSTVLPIALPASLIYLAAGVGLIVAAGPAFRPVYWFLGTSIFARLLRVFLPISVGAVLASNAVLALAREVWPVNPAILIALLMVAILVLITWIVTRVARGLGRELDTARAQTDEAIAALRHESERLAVTLRSIGDAVITTDNQGRVTLLNAVAERLTGWTLAEGQGRDIHEVFDIVSEDTGEPCENPIARVLATNGVVGLANHTALRARDGAVYSIADSGAPIAARDGRILGVVLVFRDVTEERRTEAQLRQAMKMESIGRLAGGVAHDFNNILTGIVGFTQLAQLRLDAGAPVHSDLTHVLNLANRAAALTRKLLTFSRMQPVELQPVQCNALIDESVHMLARVIGEDIRIDFTPDPDLWAVQADAGQLEQVLMNLAVNARDAMPGGGTLRITTANCTLTAPQPAVPRAVQPGAYVCITVADTGCGITPDVREHIFEPFFTTKSRGKGTGLGLAVIHGIMQQHGGSIRVESAPARGATFMLYLPRLEADVQVPADAAPVAAPRGHERVLLVEDEEDVREVTRRILEAHGYTVVTAASASDAEALCLAAANPFDLLLTDVVMPDGNGIELARGLRALQPSLRVLFISGYADSALIDAARAGDAFLPKPFPPETLLLALRRLLDASDAEARPV
jgi:PAS domain S-box-containing protein